MTSGSQKVECVHDYEQVPQHFESPATQNRTLY